MSLFGKALKDKRVRGADGVREGLRCQNHMSRYPNHRLGGYAAR
jgi:hypothetical protein